MTAVRFAREADLDGLQRLEDAADALLVDALQPAEWGRAPAGAARAAVPGFVLVAADPADDRVVGFAHVLEAAGQAHLEQLCVHPDAGRRGFGRALVEAAKREADGRGYARITLRTFADLPWNAPFYRTCGFVESEPDTPFLRCLVEAEGRAELLQYGRRIQMTATLRQEELRASPTRRR